MAAAGGGAAPGQLHQEGGVRSLCQECNGLVEPELLFGQGIDPVTYQRGDLELVEASGGLETEAGLGQVIEAVEGFRAPLPAALAGLPGFQKRWAAVSQAGGWSGIGLQEAQSGRLRQVFYQQITVGKHEGEGRAQLIAQLADAFLQGQVALQQAGGGLEFSLTCNRQEELALLEQVEDTVRIFFIGFPGPIRYGFAIVADGLPGHQTDTVARVFEPFIERLPIDTGGRHGDQQPMIMVFVQVIAAGVLKELASLPGVCKFQFAAADASLRPQTSTGFGFAHIDSYEEEVGLVYVRFTLVGISSILCQSHEILLLL